MRMCNVDSRWLLRACVALGALFLASPAPASPIKITVTSGQPSGGFAFSPVWFGVHGGSFDMFDSGTAASSQVQAVAEFGNVGPLSALFAGQGVQTTLASGGALPQFTPGESASTILNIVDPTVDRFLSFAAMVVPSNDMFMGNDNPTAHPIFDAGGHFLGPITFQVLGGNVWDAGTEVNNILDGGAFIQGVDATGHVAENGVVHAILPDSSGYLDSILSLTTAAGYPVSHVFDRTDLIATIQISSVPEPASLALLGTGIAGVLLAGVAVRPRRSSASR